MAYGSKKDRTFTKTKRFSSSALMNNQKEQAIKDLFQFTYYLKNSISFDIFNKKELLLSSDGKNLLKSEGYKDFVDNLYLRNWETQKIYQTTVDFYSNSLDSIIKNNKFQIQKNLKITKYKRIVKSKKGIVLHKKGDLKEFEVIFRNTLLSKIMNWLLYVEESKLDLTLKTIPIGKAQATIDNVIQFNKEINRIRCSVYWDRIKALIVKRKQRLLNKIKLVEYSTGSFIRQAKDNKSMCSHIFKDETNGMFQTWYKLKRKHLDDIYVPLATNDSFHNENFDFNASHYVSLSSKGRLNIGAIYEAERPYEEVETINSENVVGIDLNVASNFCAIAYHDREELIDYDRSSIKEAVNILKELEAKGYQQHEIKDDKRLKKLFGRIEFEMKSNISSIIQNLQLQGITDIVMEDLNLTNSKASFIKNEDLGIKYSKLIRFLRLSSIKDWFKQQANNRGLRVHLTTPSYTSQQCSCCGAIIKGNRNQRDYECKACGFISDSDCNAAQNIRGRLLLPDVLRNKLHQLEFGQLIPKKVKRETVKKLLTEQFENVDNERQHPQNGFKGSGHKRETATIINLLI